MGDGNAEGKNGRYAPPVLVFISFPRFCADLKCFFKEAPPMPQTGTASRMGRVAGSGKGAPLRTNSSTSSRTKAANSR